MIKLETLKWSNCFSYGKDNSINFIKDPITQLVGLNGHGKSSIALILELVLFNKNSKGSKTGRILNRYVDDNFYTISLYFTKDEDNYYIDSKRASTQTIKLTKNGEDISAHTATATFKLIEEILGFDHKTFCQLVYQSSAQSLEFLSATDTNRKKFLIDLLDLTRYLDAHDVFKAVAKSVQEEVAKHEQSVAVIEGWLSKNSSADLTIKDLVEVPLAETSKASEKANLEESIKNIEKTNKAIQNNNTYKSILDSIDLSNLQACRDYESDVAYVKEKTELEKDLREAKAFITKVNSLHSNCPACGQGLDHSDQLKMVDAKKLVIVDAEIRIKVLADNILKIKDNNKIFKDNEDKTSRWEQYHALYDSKQIVEILDKDELEAKVIQLGKEIKKRDLEIAEANKINLSVSSHNAKVQVISQQLVEMRADLKIAKDKLSTSSTRLTNLQILQKSFSTNGLIAYKIESMVKDLEQLVNEYLAELSYGRFQLAFVISGEKLNVVITDNGEDVEMVELSAGEKARVNTATLLAIRKLMQQLSNTKINVLILDETIGNLDQDGKEKLIELLLRETHLNTFLISHDYSHPLLEKINIIKEDNISRLES